MRCPGSRRAGKSWAGISRNRCSHASASGLLWLGRIESFFPHQPSLAMAKEGRRAEARRAKAAPLYHHPVCKNPMVRPGRRPSGAIRGCSQRVATANDRLRVQLWNASAAGFGASQSTAGNAVPGCAATPEGALCQEPQRAWSFHHSRADFSSGAGFWRTNLCSTSGDRTWQSSRMPRIASKPSISTATSFVRGKGRLYPASSSDHGFRGYTIIDRYVIGHFIKVSGPWSAPESNRIESPDRSR